MRIVFIFFVSFICICSLSAQNNLPETDSIEVETDSLDMYSSDYMNETDDAEISNSIIETSMLPFVFTGMKPNIITDSASCLSSFFGKLQMLQISYIKPIIRIVHIGDSHVRSHEITPALNINLANMFGNASATFIHGYRSSGITEENGMPGIISHCIGINGATSKNFLSDEYIKKIKNLNPDLIIISFGTNESMGKYDVSYHYNMMDALFSALKDACPKAAFLYTTPPGAFLTIYTKTRYRRNRKIISVEENRNTNKVAATIARFAAEHNAACWDLYNIAGGEKFACKNWISGDYFRPDKVHFSIAGYRLQGNLLYDALVNSYNEYIER